MDYPPLQLYSYDRYYIQVDQNVEPVFLTILPADAKVYSIEDELDNEQALGAILALSLIFYASEHDYLLSIVGNAEGPLKRIRLIEDDAKTILGPYIPIIRTGNNLVIPEEFKRIRFTFFWVQGTIQGSTKFLVKTSHPQNFLQGFITVLQGFNLDYRSYIISPIYYCDNNRVLHEQIIQ